MTLDIDALLDAGFATLQSWPGLLRPVFCAQSAATVQHRPRVPALPDRQSRPTSSGRRRGLWVLQGGGDDVDENYVRMGDSRRRRRLRRAARVRRRRLQRVHLFPVPLRLGRNHRLRQPRGGQRSVRHRRPSAMPRRSSSPAATRAVTCASGRARRCRMRSTIVAAKPAPIGGTSAGMAVLGEFVYSAMLREPDQHGGARRPLRQGRHAGAQFPRTPPARRHHHRPAPAGTRPDRPHRRPCSPG